MTQSKKIMIKQLPHGVPKPSEDFEIANVILPALEAGEILVEAEWISVDPYLRGNLPKWGVGAIVQSFQVARVVKSRDPDFLEGEFVFGHLQWASRSVIKAKDVQYKVPQDPSFSRSHYVGAYGMPSKTAWYGMLNVGKLKRGENVLISAAAGAVGSVAGQIAKLHDCFVVGVCGSAKKCAFLTQELGFDAAVNYKSFNNDSKAMEQHLRKLFAKDTETGRHGGIDIYFDNTGGFLTAAVWELLNFRARVLICGQIANYNRGGNLACLEEKGGVTIPKMDDFLYKLIYREIHVLGMLVTGFKDQTEFKFAMKRWIEQGKVKARQTIVQGFESIPKAFSGLFSGENIGKMVIHCGSGDEEAEAEAEEKSNNGVGGGNLKKRILMVLSSHTEMPQSAAEKKAGAKPHPTGWYLPEAAHPWHTFTKNGFKITWVSPKGGLAACDVNSLHVFSQDPVCKAFKTQVMDAAAKNVKTKKISQIGHVAQQFDAICFVGGHGVMWDFPHCEAQNKAAEQIYNSGGIVSAVCHGPAALLNLKAKDGNTPLVKGRKVTGFTNTEEDAIAKSDVMPFMLETELKKRGAVFSAVKDWDVNVVVDGTLITGQNPSSAGPLAQAVVDALRRKN